MNRESIHSCKLIISFVLCRYDVDPPRIAEDVPFMTGIASGTGGNRFDDNFDRFQSNKRKGDYDDHRGPKRTNYGG